MSGVFAGITLLPPPLLHPGFFIIPGPEPGFFWPIDIENVKYYLCFIVITHHITLVIMKKQIQHITTFDIQTGQITIYMDQNKAAETLNLLIKPSLIASSPSTLNNVSGVVMVNKVIPGLHTLRSFIESATSFLSDIVEYIGGLMVECVFVIASISFVLAVLWLPLPFSFMQDSR